MNVTDYEPPQRVDALADRVIGGVLPVDEALTEACRVAVAEELRRQADYYRQESKQEYQRANRLANSGQKWKYEAAVATSQTLKFTEKRLCARADALDPEGATR